MEWGWSWLPGLLLATAATARLLQQTIRRPCNNGANDGRIVYRRQSGRRYYQQQD